MMFSIVKKTSLLCLHMIITNNMIIIIVLVEVVVYEVLKVLQETIQVSSSSSCFISTVAVYHLSSFNSAYIIIIILSPHCQVRSRLYHKVCFLSSTIIIRRVVTAFSLQVTRALLRI